MAPVETTELPRIVILGGYGVFGGRLARLLLADGGADIVIAGRSRAKARAFCAQHGGRPLAIDRDRDLANVFNGLRPAIVIDAAGPFQAYGDDPYRVARAAIEAGAHYLDLADDAGFAAGISSLDGFACDNGVAAISGVSSVPALSAAAVRALVPDGAAIDLIETAILPGNRVPRGRSVVDAILSQVGRQVAVFRHGQPTMTTGWGKGRIYNVRDKSGLPLKRRARALCVPDIALFPERFAARNVEFRAGLELGLIDRGLWWLGLLVRSGAIRDLTALARPLTALARPLERFGSDRGAMVVRAFVRDGEDVERRQWQLVAEAGDGPFIPAVPARALVRKALQGGLPAGARPCLDDIDLDDATNAMAGLQVSTAISRERETPLFREALGPDFNRLPAPLRAVHDARVHKCFFGRGRVRRGSGPLAELLCLAFGLPQSSDDLPVTVSIERDGAAEIWTRNFGSRRFRSVLRRSASDGKGRVRERFGPVSIEIDLALADNALSYPVGGGSFARFRLPSFLVPRSETRESVDEDGRFCFSVRISLPLTGLLISYEGWLEDAS